MVVVILLVVVDVVSFVVDVVVVDVVEVVLVELEDCFEVAFGAVDILDAGVPAGVSVKGELRSCVASSVFLMGSGRMFAFSVVMSSGMQPTEPKRMNKTKMRTVRLLVRCIAIGTSRSLDAAASLGNNIKTCYTYIITIC